MTKCGIICEYNPFHNGHKYHLQKTKKITNSDIVCVMSGDFTQRCLPAIFDKSLRVRAAIENGASAVIELPALYSTATAEFFAYGAVKIFSQIQELKYISFGTETDDTDLLIKIAKVQADESKFMKDDFTALIKTGLSYPRCIAQATANEFVRINYSKNISCSENGLEKLDSTKNEGCFERKILEVLSAPNNVLAIEYLKAIKKLNLNITPVFIRRTDSGYNSNVLSPPFAAAGAIRKLIENGQNYSAFAPMDFGVSPLNNSIFEALAYDSLLWKEISYDEGLGIRLKKAAQKYSSLAEIIEKTKTKRYTSSRINRLILNTMLDIGCGFLKNGSDFFFKLLGIKKSFKSSLKDFNNNLITRFDKLTTRFNESQTNQFDNKTDGNRHAGSVLAIDKRASDLYSIMTSQPPSRFYSKLQVF